MKYRIESPEDNLVYEAERSWEDFELHSEKLIAGETNEVWTPIDKWSKKHPIL